MLNFAARGDASSLRRELTKKFETHLTLPRWEVPHFAEHQFFGLSQNAKQPKYLTSTAA